jgi:hypothetical protein
MQRAGLSVHHVEQQQQQQQHVVHLFTWIACSHGIALSYGCCVHQTPPRVLVLVHSSSIWCMMAPIGWRALNGALLHQTAAASLAVTSTSLVTLHWAPFSACQGSFSTLLLTPAKVGSCCQSKCTGQKAPAQQDMHTAGHAHSTWLANLTPCMNMRISLSPKNMTAHVTTAILPL